jgi:hypothetical protein
LRVDCHVRLAGIPVRRCRPVQAAPVIRVEISAVPFVDARAPTFETTVGRFQVGGSLESLSRRVVLVSPVERLLHGNRSDKVGWGIGSGIAHAEPIEH